MDSGVVSRRIIAACLAAALVAPVPASGETVESRQFNNPSSPSSSDSSERQTLERLLEIADANGVSERVLPSLDDVGTPIQLFASIPWPDLSGNGLQDVLVVELEAVEAAFLWTGTLDLTARDGLNGRKLWSKTVRFENGVALPTTGRVGQKGRHGVIVMEIKDLAMGFVGFSDKGKKVYDYEESLVGSGEVPAIDRRVVNVGLLDAIEGRATDILFGVARGTTVGIGALGTVNLTEVTILDGRNGELITHAEPEISVGSPPVPFPGPDIDRDGLDDYVVLGVLPEPDVGGQSGLPELADLTADYVRGRRGSDGTKLWTSDPLQLSGAPTTSVGPLVFYGRVSSRAQDAGDLTADKTGDVLVTGFGSGEEELDRAFHVLDGASGLLSWSGDGDVIVPLPDLDRDSKRDVFSVTSIHKGKKVSLSLKTYSGRLGKRIYKRSYRLKGTTEEGGTFLIVLHLGDVDPDGIPEFFVRLGWSDGRGRSRDMEMFVNVRNGKRHRLRLRSDEWLSGPVDGRGDDVIRYLGPAVEVFDGGSRRELLDVLLLPPGGLYLDPNFFFGPTASRIDRDRCADLVGGFFNQDNYYTVMIDGGTGTLRWSTKERGPLKGAPRIGARRDNNPAC